MQQPTSKERCAILNNFYRLNKGGDFLKTRGFSPINKSGNKHKMTSYKRNCSEKSRGFSDTEEEPIQSLKTGKEEKMLKAGL